MKREIAEKLVTELRSGNYVKGTGKLKQIVDGETLHCCLGVLSDIAVAEGVIAKPDLNLAGDTYFYDNNDQMPLGMVDAWAGETGWASKYKVTIETQELADKLSRPEARYNVGSTVLLAEINDHTDLSFNDIADLIEKEYISA